MTLATPSLARHFLRCLLCLTVVAVERPAGRFPEVRNLCCGACGGKFDYMGIVREERIEKVTGFVSVCDHRCTNARGPICDCPCGGANHGTGAVRPVVEVNGIPTVEPFEPEKARAVVAEYRAAYDAAKSAIDFNAEWDRVYRAKARGEYLNTTDYSIFWNRYRAVSLLRDAEKARTQNGRLSKLRKVVEMAAVRS